VELEQLVLNALWQVRPDGIKVDAYPQVVSMVVNLVILELTREEREGGTVR
jgi:hypothetical protein